MGVRLAVSFAAGFASVVTPCVLPLVPGYLSAVSSVGADELGRSGNARRVAVASLPFIVGFTVVFVVLGAGAAAIGNAVSASAQTDVAGFVLVVLGLAFVGLLPVPERVVAPGLLSGARRRGSGALLGGAFAVCAAPCIGTVLAAVLVLASDTGTALKGAALLAAYALGLGGAFLVAGVAFARAMSAFRWLRDRYTVIQVASGITLVALGLLLFFHRDWWLHVALNRALIDIGLTEPLDLRRIEGERAARDRLPRPLDLREHGGDVDAPVGRRERPEPPRRLLELPRRRDGPPAPGLVPRDRDVDEPLVEVALLGGSRAPRRLELLVRLEEPAGADVLEPRLVRVTHLPLTLSRGHDPALWGRPLLPRQARGAAARASPDHGRPHGRSRIS